MKYLKNLLVFTIMAMSVVMISSCGGNGEVELANEMTFDISNINEIAITYDDEDITFYQSDNDKLIVKEYMSVSKKQYHGKISEKDNCIHISEGGKPMNKSNFNRYVEVYLPKAYDKTLTTESTSGTVDFLSMDIKLPMLNASTTSGILRFKNVESDFANLTTTSGTIECDRIKGKVKYTTTSGSINIASAYGSGEYGANNSGEMNITYNEVDGDLNLFNKNDDINLKIPTDLECDIKPSSKNGEITVPNSDVNADIKIKAETVNGNINITR